MRFKLSTPFQFLWQLSQRLVMSKSALAGAWREKSDRLGLRTKYVLWNNRWSDRQRQLVHTVNMYRVTHRGAEIDKQQSDSQSVN